MAEKHNILIVDDDRIIMRSLCEFLSEEGFQTFGVETMADAVAQLEMRSYCLVITDSNLPDGNGFELLDMLKENYPQTVAIIITSSGTIEEAVLSIKRGN